VFPANEEGETIWSHRGLTYGGMIMAKDVTTIKIVDSLNAINNYYKDHGYSKVIYKVIPWIYYTIPSEEGNYALYKNTNARLISCGISSTINMSYKPKFKELRRRGVKKALKNGLIVRESNDIDTFWNILSCNLEVAHGVKPVHTIDEIKLLIYRFPDNIKLYAAFKNEIMLGGSLLFETGKVIHSQYISASEEGKRLGALDLVFDELINKICKDCQYFDFGISTEENGQYLNENLIFQKEGFGGHGVVYNIYEYSLV
jgi:hypothetical protein